MNQKIKDILGLSTIIAVVFLSWGVFKYVDAYSKSIQPSSFRSFGVSAEGKVTAVPDVAVFTFSIISEAGKDINSARNDNTDKTNKAIDFVKSKGVDAKDIKTLNYDINPRYQYYSCREGVMGNTGAGAANGGAALLPSKACPPPEIVGYTITQTVQVKIRDFSKTGDIVDGTVSAGANQTSGIRFTIDDPAKVQDAAREQAIIKAKEKAQQVAQAGNFKAGRLLSIEEGNQIYPVYDRYSEGKGIGTAAAAPAIEPGSQDVSVTVTLRYEIK